MVTSGELKKGSKVWVFTDNMTVERTYYKGSSSSPHLHELVLEVRKIEMKGLLKIHCVWFSGKRMIWQGTNGLSRGDLTSGVMAGEAFLKFIPLNETVFQRDKSMKSKLLSTLPGEWRVSTKEDWFYRACNEPDVRWVWAPPPALAQTVLELMCEMKHMFPKSRHVFICPALMTGKWQKFLKKIAGVTLFLTPGNPVWASSQFEPHINSFICHILDSCRLPTSGEKKRPRMCWSDSHALRSHMRKLWAAKPPGKNV